MSEKISAMVSATDLVGAVVPIVQGGANKKADQNLIWPANYYRGTSRRFGPQLVNTGLGAFALGINSLRAIPMYFGETMTLELLGFNITVGATGKMWVAIYDTQGADGGPGNLIAWTNEKTIVAPAYFEDLNLVTSDLMTPGFYWVAYLTDTANTATSLASINNGLQYLGIGGGSTAWGTGVSAVLAYQATPPDPFPAHSISAAGFNFPFIYCKISVAV